VKTLLARRDAFVLGLALALTTPPALPGTGHTGAAAADPPSSSSLSLKPVARAVPRSYSPPSPSQPLRDPILQRLEALERIHAHDDPAPLWDFVDADLEGQVLRSLRELRLIEAVRRKRLAVVLVDLPENGPPRVASINGDRMLYAASLPKIAVLLGAFEKIAAGRMALDPHTEMQLEDMIRVSSNRAATAMMREVGKEYIARVLLSPRYRLYDPRHNGGLWVGKDYASAGLWRRDPLHNLSHGATAMQVARFYYLLHTEQLVTPQHSRKMKEILARPALRHKFVGALEQVNPAAALYRKSGSWRTFHSDSVLVERGRHAYIAVALADSPQGQGWLPQLAVRLDGIVFGQSWLHGLASRAE